MKRITEKDFIDGEFGEKLNIVYCVIQINTVTFKYSKLDEVVLTQKVIIAFKGEIDMRLSVDNS